MKASVAYPVQVLREHITELEAAISVCLADPDHKPVHRLRTETRRIEALLLLLGLIPGLPDHRKESATLLRALTRLRRAAGTVRDLDVHRKMLESFAEAEQGQARTAEKATLAAPAKAAKSGGAKSARKSSTAEAEPEKNAALLSESAVELRKQLGRERDKAATVLQEVLKDRQTKTAKAAEALLKAVESAEQFALPASDLLHDAEAVLTRDGLLRDSKLEKLDKDDLHTIRKSAKKARYLAESLPDDAVLAAAAQRFEELQEAGGQWHDALELVQAARRIFGKNHALTATYREDRNRKLEAYRALLTKFTPEKKPKQASKQGKRPAVKARRSGAPRSAAVAAA